MDKFVKFVLSFVLMAVLAMLFMASWNTFFAPTLGFQTISFVSAWAMLILAKMPFAPHLIRYELNQLENFPPFSQLLTMSFYIIFTSLHLYILYLFL